MNHHEDFDPLSPELYSGFGDDDDGLRFLPKVPQRGPDLGAAPVSLQVECNSEVRAGETKVTSQDEVGSFGRMVGVAPPMATMTYVAQPMLSPPQQMLQPHMLVAPQVQMHAVPHHTAHPPSRMPPPDYNNRKSDDTYDTRCNIYVASMPRTFDDHKLAAYFSRFGPIVSAKVMCDHATGISKGYGFVLFKSEESAARAVNEMAGQQVEGMRIQVRWAHFDATPTTRSTSYAVGTTNNGALAINTAESAPMRAPGVVHPSATAHQPGVPLQINSALSSPQGSFTSNNSPSHAPPAYGVPAADANRASKPVVVTAPQPMIAHQWYAQQPATVPMMVQYPVMNSVPYMMPAQAYPAPHPYQMVMMPDPSMMGQPRMMPHQPDGYYMVPASATTAPPPGAIYVSNRKR